MKNTRIKKPYSFSSLLLKNLIVFVFVTGIIIVLYAILFSEGYNRYAENKKSDEAQSLIRLDDYEFNSLTNEELLLKNAQFLLLSDNLKVVDEKGQQFFTKDEVFSQEDFLYLIQHGVEQEKQFGKYTYVDFKTVEYNGTPYLFTLIQIVPYTSINTFKIMMWTILGVIVIFALAVIIYINSVIAPLSKSLIFIEDSIIKTPYNPSPVNIHTSRLKEIQAILFAYNTMIEKLERTTEAKDSAEKQSKQLISNLAHDLKSPITVLKGYSEILLSDNLSEEEKKQYIGYINKNTNDLASMINLLFEQIKYHSKEYKLSLAHADIYELLRDTCASYYTIFTNNGFDFDADIPDDMLLLNIDVINMKRVFTNLLSNAMGHNPNPTKVKVCTSIVSNYLKINFMDDGIGIDESFKKDLFEPFFQANESRNGQNSGLGLYVVKQIIEKHNGTIELTSTADYKTCFVITLKID